MSNHGENLPIEAFKDEIMGSNAQYIIIEAETGSGKSTMVPQWYHALGMKVLVTEPLIETVIGTSEYVAQLMGISLGTTVGYRTGEVRKDSPDTEILFCTDGLALVRELARHNRFDVLIIDELHQWNTNQSTLEAWVWKHLQEGTSPFKKVIVLSATLDSSTLSAKRGNAPIFKVPGRQFPITDRPEGASIVSDVRSLVAEGFDVLVFQPGEREILACISDLAGINAELIPFYGKLDREQKNRAYGNYNRPKVVVSTNALETGRTLVPSTGRKLAVVDSGMERRIELTIDGIEVLALKPISKAQASQRRGRTGRVGEGLYIDHCSNENRPDFPIPELLRTRLDQTVLRLAVVGYDATELPFFHQLDKSVIDEAKRALKALGAFHENGTVTETGRLMARLPVRVQYARMIVEADKRGVVDDVITIAAILEGEGIGDRTRTWRNLTKEANSDLLAQLDLYAHARLLSHAQLREVGIFAQAYYRAKELRNKLRDALKDHGVHLNSTENRQDILRACVAGMVDHLYQRYSYGSYRNGGVSYRQLARESVVDDGEWIVGLPKDIQFKGRRGGMQTLNLVSMVSRVDPTWLVEVAPQLSSQEKRNYRYDATKGMVVCDLVTKFNGHEIKTEPVPGDGEEATKAFALAILNGYLNTLPDIAVNNAKLEEVEEIRRKSGGAFEALVKTSAVRFGSSPFAQSTTTERPTLLNWYVGKLGGVYVREAAEKLNLKLTDADVSVLLGIDYLAKRIQIQASRPDSWTIDRVEYPMVYKLDTGFFNAFQGVEIKLPLLAIDTLGSNKLPSWEGMKLRIYVADEGYTDLYVTLPEQTLETLREKIETRRREMAWNAFKSTGHGDLELKYEIPYSEELPALPDPLLWDETTSAYAYPALVYYPYLYRDKGTTVWYLRWFQSDEEAKKLREESEAKKAEKHTEEERKRNS